LAADFRAGFGGKLPQVIDAIDEVMETQDSEAYEPAARILGVHYEGVFANEKCAARFVRDFFKTFKNGDEIAQMPSSKRRSFDDARAGSRKRNRIDRKTDRRETGLFQSGHTKAGTENFRPAFAAGARHLTHFYNAMTRASSPAMSASSAWA
jgi:N-acetylglucosamine-6-phosphate deacetylase